MTYLVTTKDERGQPAGSEDAVWLWRSCAEKPALGAPPPRLASPFYPALPERLALVAESRAIYESVMPRLIVALNTYHGTTYDYRQWEIMVGPFLARYIRVVLNRYFKLDHCLRRDGVTRSLHLARETDVAPADTLHLIWLTEDDEWNHEVTSWFLRDFFPTIDVEKVADIEPYRASVTERRPRCSRLRSAMERLRANRPLYIYDLAASRPLKLQFYLWSGQMPLAPNPLRINAPVSDRAGLVLPGEASTLDHRGAVDRYLFRLMPKCFVETFGEHQHEAQRDSLPVRPRVMITSTSFDTDEVFKMKVASEVGRGSRYVVLQHGAVYGVNPFFADTVEERTADAFITWGWKKTARHVPAFCLTTSELRIDRRAVSDRVVLVTINQRRKKFIWDVEPEFDAYMKDQFDFVDSLGILRRRLTIRLHPAHVRSLGHERERFADRYPEVELDPGFESLWKSVGQYRLAIFTYDSSGLLEMLNLNLPVIGFWDPNGFDQVSPEAAPFYETLRDAGIVYDSPKRLAAFVTESWNRIEEWWASAQVQEARVRFCERYAAPSGGVHQLRSRIA